MGDGSMNRDDTLPIGNYLSLVSVDGFTYCAYTVVGVGLQVYKWPDGDPHLRTLVYSDPSDRESTSWARLAVVGAEVLILYHSTTYVTGANITTGERVPWQVDTEGNNPCAWGPGGLFALQRKSDLQVVTGYWPDVPTHEVRPALATGVWSVQDLNYVTMEVEARYSVPGMANPRYPAPGVWLGIHPHGGVGTRYVNLWNPPEKQWGRLEPGQDTSAPDGCLQTSHPGSLFTVGYHVTGSHGTVQTVILSNITEEELLRPRFLPYDRPKAMGVIWGSSEEYGYWPSAGNTEVLFRDFDKMVTPRPVIFGKDAIHIPPARKYAEWCPSLEALGTTFRPRAGHTDGPVYDQAMADRLGSGEPLLVQAYPAVGEPLDAFIVRISGQLDRFPNRIKMIVAAWFDENGLMSLEDILAMVPGYDALLRRPDVLGMLAFDYARSGLKFHPEWLRWYTAMTMATPGLPVLPDPEPPDPFVKGVRFPEVAVKGGLRLTFKDPTTGNLITQYLRVDPTPVPGASGDARWPVHADRSAVGPHEEVEVVTLADSYSRFTAANRMLSITRDGRLETRVAGTRGPWESLQAVLEPDGKRLVYRFEGQLVVGLLEFIKS
jgi:hypothetical protein